jgi:hypothetical protein
VPTYLPKHEECTKVSRTDEVVTYHQAIAENLNYKTIIHCHQSTATSYNVLSVNIQTGHFPVSAESEGLKQEQHSEEIVHSSHILCSSNSFVLMR